MALKDNIIAFLDTGTGKTLISLLLIQDYIALNRVCFVAPTIHLVSQQAQTIREFIGCKTVELTSMASTPMDLKLIEQSLTDVSVIVCTPQSLVNYMRHGMLRFDQFSLLILDECHHTTGNHPYNLLMEMYHKFKLVNDIQLRVFGMTASPVRSGGVEVTSKLLELQKNMDARLVSVSKDQLIMNKAQEVIVRYSADSIDSLCQDATLLKAYKFYMKRLVEIVNLVAEEGDENLYGKFSKMVRPVNDTKIELGTYCATQVANNYSNVAYSALLNKREASSGHIVYFDDNYDGHEMEVEIPDLIDLNTSDETFKTSRLPKDYQNMPKIPEFNDITDKRSAVTDKVIRLCDILENYCGDDFVENNFRCLVFVEKRATAKSLASLLDILNPGLFSNCLKVGFAVGSHSGMKESESSSINSQVFNSFKEGKINLLVVTSVAEEGIDVTQCNIVIMFSPSKTASAYIQSRGRARMPGSKYFIMVSSDSDLKQIVSAQLSEKAMKNVVIEELLDNGLEVGEDIIEGDEDLIIPATGAIVTRRLAPDILRNYVQSIIKGHLTEDDGMEFQLINGVDSFGYAFTVMLPLPSPLANTPITGPLRLSKLIAWQSVCLMVCKMLFQIGALNDRLLVDKIIKKESRVEIFTDEESSLTNYDFYIPECFRPVILTKEVSHRYVMQNISNLSISVSNFTGYRIEISVFNDSICVLRYCLIIPRKATTLNVELYKILIHPRSMFGIDAESFKVHVRFIDEELSIAASEYEKYVLFHIKFFSLIMRIRDDARSETTVDVFEKEYVLVPLLPGAGFNPDVLLMDGVFSFSFDQTYDKEFQKGDLVIAKHNFFKYILLKHRSDLNVDSKIITDSSSNSFSLREYFEKKLDVKFDNDTQVYQCTHSPVFKNYLNPLKNKEQVHEEQEPMFMVQSLVVKSPFSSLQQNYFFLIPAITYRTENYCLILELLDRVILHSLKKPADSNLVDLLLTACSAPTLYDYYYNYEILEWFGDACLKFYASVDVFNKSKSADEGTLTTARGRIVSNEFLHSLALKLNLVKYIIVNPFFPNQFHAPFIKPWIPLRKADDETGFAGRLYKQISKKMLADVVEAILGALCVFDQNSCISFMRNSGIISQLALDIFSGKNPGINENLYPEGSAADPRLEYLMTEKLKYQFKRPSLLFEALSHPSAGNERSYERLEFLGDACLDFIVSKLIYEKFSRETLEKNETTPSLLTELRQQIVNNISLGRMIVENGLQDFLLYNSSVLREEIHEFTTNYLSQQEYIDASPFELDLEPPKALGDMLESLVGAILVDSCFNFDLTFKIVNSCFLQTFMDRHLTTTSLKNLKTNPVRLVYETYQSYTANGESQKVFTGDDLQFQYFYSRDEDLWHCSFLAKQELKGFAKNKSKIIARRQASVHAINNLLNSS